MKITVQTSVSAPIEKVWSSYTTAEDIIAWNAASADWHTTKATIDLRVGGHFSSRMEAKDGSMGFDFPGTYTAVIPNQKISYQFGERAADVSFESKDTLTVVTIVFDAETVFPPEQQQQGWQAILDNFKRYVENH